MLNSLNRISSNYDYKIVRKYGERFNTELFTMYYLPQRDLSLPSRIGFVVPNKLCKSAPLRNRVKRVFREVFRLNLAKIADGYLITVFPGAKSLTCNYEEINSEFTKVLQKVPFAR
ncbi:MAG: ribonuclease P protein component [Patescibacteria group bacterium]